MFFAAFVYLQLKTYNIEKTSGYAVTFAFSAAVLLFLPAVPDALRFTAGTLLLAYTVCSLDTSSARLRRLLSSKFIVAAGIYSFSLYIWQQVFYKLFQDMRATDLLSAREGLILRPAFIIAACAAGIMSFHFIETPGRRYINRKWAARGASKPLTKAVGWVREAHPITPAQPES